MLNQYWACMYRIEETNRTGVTKTWTKDLLNKRGFDTLLRTINPKGQVVIFHFGWDIIINTSLYCLSLWLFIGCKILFFAYCAKGDSILGVAWNPEIGCNPV